MVQLLREVDLLVDQQVHAVFGGHFHHGVPHNAERQDLVQQKWRHADGQQESCQLERNVGLELHGCCTLLRVSSS